MDIRARTTRAHVAFGARVRLVWTLPRRAAVPGMDREFKALRIECLAVSCNNDLSEAQKTSRLTVIERQAMRVSRRPEDVVGRPLAPHERERDVEWLVRDHRVPTAIRGAAYEDMDGAEAFELGVTLQVLQLSRYGDVRLREASRWLIEWGACGFGYFAGRTRRANDEPSPGH